MNNLSFLYFIPLLVAAVCGQGTLRKSAESSDYRIPVDENFFHKDSFGQDSKLDPNAEACVSLLVYADTECTGVPVQRMTFPTATQPGSPCCKFQTYLCVTVEANLTSISSLRP